MKPFHSLNLILSSLADTSGRIRYHTILEFKNIPDSQFKILKYLLRLERILKCVNFSADCIFGINVGNESLKSIQYK